MTRSIVAIGIVAGVAGGDALGRVATSYLENMQRPGALPVLVAAAVLSGATVVASLIPAARAPHAWTRYRRSVRSRAIRQRPTAIVRGTRKPTTRGE